MNVVQEIGRINQRELDLNIWGGRGGSWHDEYKNSAWVFVGGLKPELSEGDVICVMSQWGEIEDINLPRDKSANKSQGFAFVKYEDQRSTILAVDNFNNIEVLGKTLRVDHVHQYKLPKDVRERESKILEEDPGADVVIGAGHAYKDQSLLNQYSISHGQDLWAPATSLSSSSSSSSSALVGRNEGKSDDKSRKRSREGDRLDKAARKEEKRTLKKDAKEQHKREKMEKELERTRERREKKEKKDNKKDSRSDRHGGGELGGMREDRASSSSLLQSSSGAGAGSGGDVHSWMGSRDPKLPQ